MSTYNKVRVIGDAVREHHCAALAIVDADLRVLPDAEVLLEKQSEVLC